MLNLNPYVDLIASGACGISHYKDCHVYLIHDENEFGMMDAGSGLEVETITSSISKLGFSPDQHRIICLTHAHADHAGGAKPLSDWSGCSVAASAFTGRLVESGDEINKGLEVVKRYGRYPSDYTFSPCKVDILVDEDWTYNIGKITIRAIMTPGHSPGHVSYITDFPDGSKGIFGGDIVFWGGYINLLNSQGSDLQAYRQSIIKFQGLNITSLFPGHGMWDIKRGQKHLDAAIERFQGPVLPPNVQLD